DAEPAPAMLHDLRTGRLGAEERPFIGPVEMRLAVDARRGVPGEEEGAVVEVLAPSLRHPGKDGHARLPGKQGEPARQLAILRLRQRAQGLTRAIARQRELRRDEQRG